MFRRLLLYFFLALGAFGSAYAQSYNLDSLRRALSHLPNDTLRAQKLHELIEQNANSSEIKDVIKLMLHLLEADVEKVPPQSRESVVFRKELAFILLVQGDQYLSEGLTHQGEELLERGLQLYTELNDRSGKAEALNLIAIVKGDQGKIEEALENLRKAWKLREELNDKAGISIVLNNMAGIYSELNDEHAALDYYNRSLAIKREMGDKRGMSNTFNNIASMYAQNKDYLNAIKYNDSALLLRRSLGYTQGIAMSLSNLANNYQWIKDFKKSLELLKEAQQLVEKNNDQMGMIGVYCNLGNQYYLRQDFSNARIYYQKGKAIALKLGFPETIMQTARLLVMLNKATGDHHEALENFELMISMRDSISSEKNKKAMMRDQLRFEYEKQAAADSVAHAKESEIKNAELAKQSAEIKAKKNQQYALFGGLFCVCLFGAFMYNRFKVTQKQKTVIEHQKAEVEEQKKLVEEKQKEILDSIHYAQRIQLALMPSEKRVSNYMNKVKH